MAEFVGLLEELISNDATKVWSASCKIRNMRNVEELRLLSSNLEQIIAATRNVELGGALRSNRTHLNFALLKLQFIKSNKGCLCKLYPKDDLYNPVEEERVGNVKNLRGHFLEGGWIDHYECECVVCCQKFKVEEREYHYTWWVWNLA